MKKILFIVAHRPDRSPGQRFRFEQYLNFLNERGFETEVSFFINKEDDEILYQPGHYFKKLNILIKNIKQRLKDLKKAGQSDIVFIYREAFMLGSVYFEKRFAKTNAKVVFDFDDSIWLTDISVANQKFEWLKNSTKTSKIIRLADVIFAGNQYLADYALKYNSNVLVVPTTINTDLFKYQKNEKSHDSICIGWSGSLTTIKHFEYAVPILRQLKHKYKDKICFKVIGDENYKNDELEIKGRAWTSENEVTELSSFDIGIMPLPNDEWAKGKCGLKGLSYMALGIPTIMSPVGVNTEIIQHGVNGFLANTNDEWIEVISKLIESPELRLTIGQQGRKTVEEKYSVLSQQERYLRYFQQLTEK